MLTADKVLVTVGTPCSMSAVGSTETYQARVANTPEFIAFAAFDAGLVDFDQQASAEGRMELRWAKGELAGQPASLQEIEAQYGSKLRAQLGIRSVADRYSSLSEPPLDIAAPLPHDSGST